MSKQNYDELFGPPGASDYKIGDTIRFKEAGQILTGEIIHIAAPGETPVTHKHVPTSYQIDCGDGWPHIAYQSDIVEPES
jgi:hypothetical protein